MQLLDPNDILLTLTINNSKYKEDITTLTAKIFILKELKEIHLDGMANWLYSMGINKLNIFCIDKNNNEDINQTVIETPAEIIWIDINIVNFIKFLNRSDPKFIDYNKESLYIIRNSDFLDVKSLFQKIDNNNINIGRGGGQKNALISPLEFRLNIYLMAMFDFKYQNICNYNAFNDLNKERYLPYYYHHSNNKHKK